MLYLSIALVLIVAMVTWRGVNITINLNKTQTLEDVTKREPVALINPDDLMKSMTPTEATVEDQKIDKEFEEMSKNNILTFVTSMLEGETDDKDIYNDVA